MMSENNNVSVVDFASASRKFKQDREHDRKEAKVDEMKARFSIALPDKKTPVKDFLRKKKAKKKR